MKINVNNASLKTTAGRPDQFPRDARPQVAFSGRSNVGKSSLINSLLRRKSLARTSASPGKTITVNFYDVDGKLFLVDLPGYGFAKRSAEDKRRWSSLTDGYFTKNPNIDLLKLVVQLVDSRIGPTKDDLDMLAFMGEYGIPHVIVATKSDKLNATGKKNIVEQLEKEPLCAKADGVVRYSAASHTGRDEVWGLIASACGL
ncbi:MAG: YihA family ribosome biogenesis GTP-binding protein [Clostridia bacterium]|nr:YihA family ribosome biogenesis GTP-binding protein [Clostridia bacterium]